ncbi:glucose dehydrogenase [Candidatus Tenderia electrophaga]|jgi:glucose/arabinose dehydrogenase|uniref:Glucose dehydrogenase n=1 Tax=Candidatus Tenderia electrophaga TaxID=1748243 RepID=A0A0S2THB7_9GAMM|nr:glucose dehydrogenase [Candidatus Tenderia electrophaga]
MNRLTQQLTCFAFIGLLTALPASAAESVTPQTVVSGLEHPWSMAFMPDGRILVTERPGRLRVIENGRLKPTPIKGLPEITAVGQGGLLDIILHPDYARNGWLYFSYVAAGDGGIGTEVARAKLEGMELQDVQVLFRMQPKSNGGRHFGSRLVIDKDNYLYISLGDRGERERAQQLDDHAGSIIRLHDDGRVPEDNPFVGRQDAKPEIYSYGHRNAQGLTLHPHTGAVWEHEHGPQGGDELNLIKKGVNYGWPVITYGVNYVTGTKIGEGTHKQGMEQPLYYWDPSIAPSGMDFYSGDKFPKWQGDLFIGALKFELLVRLPLDGRKVLKEERLLKGTLGRIRDVQTGPDGYLYLLTDADDGKLVRLTPD